MSNIIDFSKYANSDEKTFKKLLLDEFVRTGVDLDESKSEEAADYVISLLNRFKKVGKESSLEIQLDPSINEDQAKRLNQSLNQGLTEFRKKRDEFTFDLISELFLFKIRELQKYYK